MEFEEGEIWEYEDGWGQNLEYVNRQRREEPDERELPEDACGKVEAEVKGEEAEESPERNEEKGISSRAKREKDGVLPRCDGGRDETWEAKKVKESKREERLMALEVEAAKLGLVLSNEDTEGNERVSLTRCSFFSCRVKAGLKEWASKRDQKLDVRQSDDLFSRSDHGVCF
jgi:hypothetical protein